MELAPVERRSVAAAVFDQLSALILAGSIDAGEALPSERTLTESLGVNRQAVREALQRLDQLGLVEIRHGGVTRVRDFRRTGTLDLLSRLGHLPDGSVDATVVRSVMEMRAAIGTDAAGLCAARATAEILAGLNRAVTDLKAGTTIPERARADGDFWDLIVEGSGNIAYRLSLNTLRRAYEPVAALVEHVLAPELDDIAAHRAVAAAITSGDAPAARAAATALLDRGTAAMTTALESR